MLHTVGFTSSDSFKCLENLKKGAVDLCLTYCGWEKCDPGHRFGPNNRISHVLHIVESGSGVFEMDHFLRSHSLKSYPAICPGIVHVCLIPGLHTGWDQKCFSTCQMILMAIHLKNIRLTRKITGRRIWRPVIGWRSSSQAET